MKKAIVSCFVLIFPLLLTSCMKGVDEGSKQKENDEKIQAYMTANALVPTRDTLGAYMIKTRSNPAGLKAEPFNMVSADFKIQTLDGKPVDQSKPWEPFVYPYGFANIIPGWELAVGWMREGEKVTMLLPYHWAFGAGGSSDGKIPAYAPIRLDLEILKVANEERQVQDYITQKNYLVSETTPEGLRIVRRSSASGDPIGANKRVTISFSSKLVATDKEFEKRTAFSYTTGTPPIELPKGVDAGIQKMKVGEKAVLVFPSSLGYGKNGRQDNNQWVVPPYYPLAYEVDVTAVQ